MNHPHRTTAIATFCIVAAGSILFCSKSVVAKLSYAHGADALTVLTLRMAFALPFFALIGLVFSRGQAKLTGADWLKLSGLGFIGYYFSSLVNFSGLQYVSAGLERIILYTYPTMVLVMLSVAFRKHVRPAMWAWSGVAWIGIVFAFAGEMHAPRSSSVFLGAALIFASAVSYALFIVIAGDTIRRLGAMRFTGIAIGISCVMMLTHYIIVRSPAELTRLPGRVYIEGIILAIFGTVLPSILMSIGLQRAGSQRFAIISSVGPVTTMLLAWALLGEKPNLAIVIGFVFTLAGGLAVTLLKDAPARPTPTIADSPALDSVGSAERR